MSQSDKDAVTKRRNGSFSMVALLSHVNLFVPAAELEEKEGALQIPYPPRLSESSLLSRRKPAWLLKHLVFSLPTSVSVLKR
jgi:hypothetical protein